MKRCGPGSSILVLSHEFPPIGGGAGINLDFLCRGLHRHGVGITLMTVSSSKRIPGPFPVIPIRTTRWKRFETNLTTMFFFCIGAVVRSLSIDGKQYGAVFSNMALPAGLPGALLSRRFRIPHIIWHHGSDVHGGRPEGAGLLQKILLRVIWRSSSVNLFVSGSLGRLALSYNGRTPDAAHVLSIGVDAPDTSARPSPEKKSFFIYLGRLEKVKNPLLALHAWKLLTGRDGKVPRLGIYGNGSLESAMHRYIRKWDLSAHVQISDSVDHPEALRLLASSKALILPSLIEGFNSTMVEAALLGIPTIGSDVCGIRDFIVNGESGILFRTNFAQGLADAVSRLDSDADSAGRLGCSARSHAQELTTERVVSECIRHLAAVAPSTVSLERS